MINFNLLEELRTKEEIIKYFEMLGKNITEEELDTLKQSYDQTEKVGNTLTIKQLDKIAGGLKRFGFVQWQDGSLKPAFFKHYSLHDNDNHVWIQHFGSREYYDHFEVRNLMYMSLSDLYNLRDFAQQVHNNYKSVLRSKLFSLLYPGEQQIPTDFEKKVTNRLKELKDAGRNDAIEALYKKANEDKTYKRISNLYYDRIVPDITALNSIIDKREDRIFNFQIAGTVLFVMALLGTVSYEFAKLKLYECFLNK